MSIHRVLLLLTVASAVPVVRPMSLIDALPGLSQAKSVFQLILRDFEGAKDTQMNFLNNGLGTSQLRSAFFLVTGRPDEALEIQKEFVANLEPLVDATPLVGHVKAMVHLAAGDGDGAVRIMEAATSTTGSVVGGVLGGPLGAIGGTVLMDAAISAIEKAVKKDAGRAHGVFSFLNDVANETSGEMFDTVAGLGLAGYGAGKLKINTMRPGPRTRPTMLRNNNYEMLPMGDRPSPASSSHSLSIPSPPAVQSPPSVVSTPLISTPSFSSPSGSSPSISPPSFSSSSKSISPPSISSLSISSPAILPRRHTV